MANFFLIEHSLRDAAGHHCDYVQCVARAANEMGFLTTIGANCGLPSHVLGNDTGLDRIGNIRRTFRKTIYQPESFLAGLQKKRRQGWSPHPPVAKSLLQRITRQARNYGFRRGREKYVQQFAADCEKFFRNTLLTPNDHAFFATVSELELMGLAIFLSRHPRTMQAHWHLQFHFNLFAGRPPEYDSQLATANAVRSCFFAALSRMSYHAVTFYATSKELADQYNRLGVGEFEPLPYPVGTEYAPSAKRELSFAATEKMVGHQQTTPFQIFHPESADNLMEDANCLMDDPVTGDQGFDRQGLADSLGRQPEPFSQPRPIRIACPGGIRREKGHAAYLQGLVDEIWEPLISSERVQLVMQRPGRTRLFKPKIELKVPVVAGSESPGCPIEYLPHPLSREQYVNLIKSTDVGLMFYDSRQYYSRRAGVLNELLASGKPVIVPAGCWLAEQIQEPVFCHADQIIFANETRRIELSDFRWESRNVPMPGGVLSFDEGRHPFHFEIEVVPDSENALGLCFDWHWPVEKGVYCRVEMAQYDHQANLISEDYQVVGHRLSKKSNVLFTIEDHAATVRFCLKNAFHASTASIRNVEVVLADATGMADHAGGIPRGSVGLIAADQRQLAQCVNEVVRHLEHYRGTAEEFSHQWYAQHDPKRTVAHLIATEFPVTKAA